jgi:ADP-ribosyl-[dinitrogen reductase] hydrolase
MISDEEYFRKNLLEPMRFPDMGDLMLDKKRGMFYGMAIGDALGAAVEFRPRGSFEEVTGYRGFGPHGLDPGQWTDDTSMALALADSIAQCGWDKADQLRRYLDWRQNGKYSVTGYLFDIGTTTRCAIDYFEATGATVSDDDIAGSGNGSIMRLAPVPIAYSEEGYSEIIQKARESSETTHASVLCRDACAYMALVLVALSNDQDRERVLSKRWWDGWGIEIHDLVYETIENDEKEPVGSGFVIDSLHASLWAFRTSDSFEEAVLKAVNLGDDSDTTGAICGQFAGAYWGYDAIPQSLIDGLDRRDMLEKYLSPLLETRV